MMIKSKADKLVFIYAHKDHTRSMLNGGTLEDVVQHANELSKTSPGGAL